MNKKKSSKHIWRVALQKSSIPFNFENSKIKIAR